MLENREPLNGFLSVPLQGKCTVCKSKIHHPKSLVLNGAFREDERHGRKHGALGDKGGLVAIVAGLGGPAVGTGEAQLGPLQPGLRVREGDTELPVSPFPCYFTLPSACHAQSCLKLKGGIPAHRPNTLPETDPILEFIKISSINI